MTPLWGQFKIYIIPHDTQYIITYNTIRSSGAGDDRILLHRTHEPYWGRSFDALSDAQVGLEVCPTSTSTHHRPVII